MRSKYILVIVMMILIGCDQTKGGGTTTPSNITNKVIKPEDKTTKINDGMLEDYKTVIINLDDLSFEDAFEIEHLAKGEGHTFWWNGSEYTTDLYVEWYGQWVRNANDIDDECKSNTYDACNVCDGPGEFTWYMDQDEDGLGNPEIFVKSCTYPSVDEE